MRYLNRIKSVIQRKGGILPTVFYITGIDRKWDDETFIEYRYRAIIGKRPDLENPRTFSEKIQWLKLHDRKALYTTLVDKYAVRDYVSKRIGEEYLIPLIGVWRNPEELDFSRLPAQFVLKTTHDSGGVLICRDRNRFREEKARAFLRKKMKRNYYYVEREWNYKNVVPKIIAEEYIENDEREGLHDYKVWCFHGKAEFVQYITGRIADVTYEGFYDRDWKLQSFSYHNPPMKEPVPRPQRLEKLLELAEKLSDGLPFGRIDFYILPNGDIKFGEITLFPMGGIERWNPEEMDLKLGEKILLPTL